MPPTLDELYREHRHELVRLVERRLRDHHEAEDAVHDAFVDAQRAINRGAVPRHPRAWLSAIALNAANRLRRRRLNAAPLEDYAVEQASGVMELRDALSGLPRSQRVALLYRDVLGLSYAETAEQMGTSVGSVQMLLHRARRALRSTLLPPIVLAAGWRWMRRLFGAGTASAATQPVLGAGLLLGAAAAGVAVAVAVGHGPRRVRPVSTATGTAGAHTVNFTGSVAGASPTSSSARGDTTAAPRPHRGTAAAGAGSVSGVAAPSSAEQSSSAPGTTAVGRLLPGATTTAGAVPGVPPTVSTPTVTAPGTVTTATAPTVTAPAVTAPTVPAVTATAPTVTVPDVTTATAPTVTTPSLTAPTLTAPTLTAPTVPLPTVTAPTVTVPTVTTLP